MFPAFTQFFDDPGATPARIKVYMAVQPPALSFDAPQPLKVDAVRVTARVSHGATVEAVRWLIRRGYLTVHHTDRRGLRTVTLAYAVRRAADVA